jgi:4-hydroxy-tetrahydrodipicolinate synthase
MASEVRGIVACLPTPFTVENKLDVLGLRTNVRFLIDHSVHALAPTTTTGEFWALTEQEYERVIQVVVDEAAGKVPVIAGVGSNNTSAAIELARAAENLGADGIFVVPPYYNRPTQEGLFQHFKAILDAVDLPTIIYNEPVRSAVNVSAETIGRLYNEYSNMIGLKESDFNQIPMDMTVTERKLPVFVIDIALLPALSLGCAGSVSVVANVVPDQMVALYQNFMENKIDIARQLYYSLLPLFEGGALFLETNPTPLKEAMNAMGLSGGNPRLPLVPLSDANKRRLLAVLKQLKLIQ